MQARSTKKHGTSYFDYKFPSSVERRRKPIRRANVRTVSEHDALYFSRVFDPGNTSRDV